MPGGTLTTLMCEGEGVSEGACALSKVGEQTKRGTVVRLYGHAVPLLSSLLSRIPWPIFSLVLATSLPCPPRGRTSNILSRSRPEPLGRWLPLNTSTLAAYTGNSAPTRSRSSPYASRHHAREPDESA